MNKYFSLCITLFVSSLANAQLSGDPMSENPFWPPPQVPGYEQCEALFNDYMDCQPWWENHGQPTCITIDKNFYETYQCPAVFRMQSKVNANAAAGNPPYLMNPDMRIGNIHPKFFR